MSITEKLDREERERGIQQAREAKKRPSLHASVAKEKRGYVSYKFPTRVLGVSSAIVLGDLIRGEILSREKSMAMRADAVQHVKNGKPLTAKGAALLGVPWDGKR